MVFWPQTGRTILSLSGACLGGAPLDEALDSILIGPVQRRSFWAGSSIRLMHQFPMARFFALSVALFVGVAQFFSVPHLRNSGSIGIQLAFSALTLAACVAFLSRQRSIFLPRLAPWLALWWLVLCLSALQAPHSYEAILVLAVLAVGFVFTLLVVYLYRVDPSVKRILIDMLLCCGVLAALLGLYQFVDFSLFGQAQRALIPTLLPPSWGGRVAGIYGQPNMFALLLTLCLLGFCYRYLHTGLQFANKAFHRLRMVPVVLVSLVFFLTQSRNGLISLVIAFGILVFLFFRRGYCRQQRRSRTEFLTLMGAVGVGFLCYWLITHLIAQDIVITERGHSSDGRFVFWASALLMSFDRPWLGVGLGNFKLVLPSYEPLAHGFLGFVEYEAMQYTHWAHNELLQILSESGVLACGLIAVFVWLYLRGFWRKFIRSGEVVDSSFLYSHLLLLPFIVQSMFSWPLRYPSLMVLFWPLLGILLAQYPLGEVRLSGGGRRCLLVLFCLALVVWGVLFRQELKIEAILPHLRAPEQAEQHLDMFDELCHNPYSETTALLYVLPRYIGFALGAGDAAFARHLIPYAERIAQLHGTNAQWYNLTLLYHKVGRDDMSRVAVERAIDQQPTMQIAWDFLHYLNILDVAGKTGQSVESLLPDAESMENFSPERLHDRIEVIQHNQNL